MIFMPDGSWHCKAAKRTMVGIAALEISWFLFRDMMCMNRSADRLSVGIVAGHTVDWCINIMLTLILWGCF